MKSFNGNAGNVKLKGKKSKVLQCGCCLAQDFRLRELIRGKQNEVDSFNRKGNNMENKTADYTIGTLLEEAPEMNCKTFIDVFLQGDLWFSNDSDFSIDLAEAYNENYLVLTPSITEGDILEFKAKFVYQEGGNEGDGEYLQYVLEFTYPNGKSECIAIEGIYNSYDSNEYSYHKPYMAKPVEKTITVWEAL